MRALVVANCTTQTYVEGIQALFPSWEVRGVAGDLAEQWISSGEKPAFIAYISACDLYVGEPMDGRRIAGLLNPKAERVIIPGLYFRGLHPDIATIADFRGPLSYVATNSQCSLIMVTARALGLSIQDTETLFTGSVYRELGYFDLYTSERRRLIALFEEHGIDLTEDFSQWEKQGSFFYVCHHPKPFVLIDILRRALLGRYLDLAAYKDSAGLSALQKDHFVGTEVWPVYPEVAARLGFTGNLTWIRPSKPKAIDLSLPQVIEDTFKELDRFSGPWKSLSFVESTALILKECLRLITKGSLQDSIAVDYVALFPHLGGIEKDALLTIQKTPNDPTAVHRCMELLRNNRRLDEIDQLYDCLPMGVQRNHAVISIWCSIPRIRGDGAEQLRRAEKMVNLFPNDAKPLNHMIFALHATKGFDDAWKQVEVWLNKYPDSIDILGPAANVALFAEKYALAEMIYRKLDKVLRDGLDPGSYRMFYIALHRQNKLEEANKTLEYARSRFPDSDVLSGL